MFERAEERGSAPPWAAESLAMGTTGTSLSPVTLAISVIIRGIRGKETSHVGSRDGRQLFELAR
jgi:hypothetical protein